MAERNRICRSFCPPLRSGGVLAPVRLLMIYALCLRFIAPALAQEQRNDVSRQLEQVKERISREEKRLNQLKRTETDLNEAGKDLAAQAQRLNDQKSGLAAAVSDLDKQNRKLEETVSRIEHQIDAQQQALRSRIVALYKTHRRMSSLGYLLAADSATELLKRSRYLAIINASDQARVGRLEQSVNSLKGEQEELNRVRQQRSSRLAELAKLEEEVNKKKFSQAANLEEARQQRQLQEKSLAKLRESAEKLEQILASIMGSGEAPPPLPPETAAVEPSPPETKPPEEATPQERPAAEPRDAVIAKSFEGRGLQQLAGRLPMPMEGSILQQFGSQQQSEFADRAATKGLEFSAPRGAQVKAVAEGRVVLNSSLPGFGNVLIVDHGERYYTLYGRLSRSLVKVGDLVAAGDAVGIVGEPDNRGRNFYFELRVRGKAVDPMRFFGTRPRAAGA